MAFFNDPTTEGLKYQPDELFNATQTRRASDNTKRAPRKASKDGSAPRKDSNTKRSSAGTVPVAAAGVVEGDVEQRVADVFVSFASSVAKVRNRNAYRALRLYIASLCCRMYPLEVLTHIKYDLL